MEEKEIEYIKIIIDYDVGETEEETVQCGLATKVFTDGTEEDIPDTDHPDDSLILHGENDVKKYLSEKTKYPIDMFKTEHEI